MAEKTPTAAAVAAAKTPAGTQAAPSPADKKKAKPDEPRDTLREIFETVVFVVVLVLLLKTFVAEAFVIPTGSMGPTLYGYQKIVTCDKCGHTFPVNCSSEVDPQHGRQAVFVTGCYCPNCQNQIKWGPESGPGWNSGDRVLVAKFLYDRDRLWKPKRHQVFVFKYPEKPQQETTAMNYIKRCEGLPGETIAIFGGDLYMTQSLRYENQTPSPKPEDRWQKENMYVNDLSAQRLFEKSFLRQTEGKATPDDFTIVRKPPDEMLAMRRIVFDNDSQPSDLAGRVFRWRHPQGRWSGDDPRSPKRFTHAGSGADSAMEWLSYAHLIRPNIPRRLELPRGLEESDDRYWITDTLGFNGGFSADNEQVTEAIGRFWVGDLMTECDVKVSAPQGELVLELSSGYDRFRARFDLATGKCKLTRTPKADGEETVLGEADTPLKKTGNYKLRFANFDQRLTVWVDGKLPFGDGVVYNPRDRIGPTKENDLEPARIGARGGQVEISHLQLWRDLYYTMNPESSVAEIRIGDQTHTIQTYYVQPGHYLALGDNSAASSDSRYWGLVPERLLLGRALVVYFPFWPFTSETRAGLIR